MAKREVWLARNVHNKTFSLGDLQLIPSFSPGSTIDLLKFYDRHQLEQSRSLINVIERGWLTITKTQDTQETFVDTNNAELATRTPDETEVINGAIYRNTHQLTDASTVTMDASLADHFYLTATAGVGATRTLGTISNPPVSGYTQKIFIEFKQSSTGGDSLLFSSDVIGGSDIPLPLSYSSGANKVDVIGLSWSALLSKWKIVAFVKGY